ncbi:MAG: uncharacterized protein KVP18_002745, partial [Porospora cf. gigantea A]|uniref:uncharacterized protein n=1 Tax=Porospora cf. gigantea A TaxID=2853593 RepID=UPI00355A976F
VLIIVPSLVFDCATLPSFNLAFAIPFGLLVVFLQVGSLALLVASAMTDPGIMPRQRNPNNAYDVNLNEFRMGLPARNQDVTYLGHLYKLKYCVSCHTYRFPRTVHCSTCDNCVERFDHHCPWLGNCVGRRNHRRFVGFLFVLSILGICILAGCIVKLVNFYSSAPRPTEALRHLWDAYLGLGVVVVAFWFVWGLLYYHITLMMNNLTTYEQIKCYYEKEWNPFDRGAVTNLRSLLLGHNRPRYFAGINRTEVRPFQDAIFEPKRPDQSQQILQELHVSKEKKLQEGLRISKPPIASFLETERKGSERSTAPSHDIETGKEEMRFKTEAMHAAPLSDMSDDGAPMWFEQRPSALPSGYAHDPVIKRVNLKTWHSPSQARPPTSPLVRSSSTRGQEGSNFLEVLRTQSLSTLRFFRRLPFREFVCGVPDD